MNHHYDYLGSIEKPIEVLSNKDIAKKLNSLSSETETVDSLLSTLASFVGVEYDLNKQLEELLSD